MKWQQLVYFSSILNHNSWLSGRLHTNALSSDFNSFYSMFFKGLLRIWEICLFYIAYLYWFVLQFNSWLIFLEGKTPNCFAFYWKILMFTLFIISLKLTWPSISTFSTEPENVSKPLSKSFTFYWRWLVLIHLLKKFFAWYCNEDLHITLCTVVP
jgi:hypothetical protein